MLVGPTIIMARGDPTPARWALRLARRARLKALTRWLLLDFARRNGRRRLSVL